MVIHKRAGLGGTPDRSETACGRNLLTTHTVLRWLHVTCGSCLKRR